MNLTIVSPLEKITHKIAWLEVETDIGNFVIQNGHVPTVLILKKDQDVTFCLTNGKQNTIKVHTGVVHVTRDSATIITSEHS